MTKLSSVGRVDRFSGGTYAHCVNGGREKNPIVAAIMAQPLTRPFRWAIKLAVVVLFCWLAWPRWWALALFCAPFAWVVWHNARVLARMAQRP